MEYNISNEYNTDMNNNYYNQSNMNMYINQNANFNHYGMTDIGKVSKINEDNIEGFKLLGDSVQCLAIADGLGSIHGGQISSVVVIDEIKNYLKKFLLYDEQNHMKQVLYSAIYMVNRVISNYQRINPELYGSFTSTITIVLINRNKQMVLGHVGNTRLYLLREGNIYQITRDDTYARDLVDCGEISEEEYKVHPDRNKLSKYIGEPNLEPYVNSGTLNKEDLLVLCSNGLFEMISEEQIKEIMYSTGNSKDACETFINAANELGGIDNIGVMVSYINF